MIYIVFMKLLLVPYPEFYLGLLVVSVNSRNLTKSKYHEFLLICRQLQLQRAVIQEQFDIIYHLFHDLQIPALYRYDEPFVSVIIYVFYL